MGPGAQGVARTQQSTQPMGPVTQGEARDVARCDKDVVAPRSSATSPPVMGVKGQVPGDLEPFSNLGKGDRGQQGTKDQGPGAEEARPGSSAPGTESLVSGPAEGRPKRAVKQPVHLVVGSPAVPRSKRTLRG